MKKLIFGMLLALTAGVFTSCQKGENFFNGTWQYVDEYRYEDKYGDYYYDIYTIELTLSKKDGSASLVVDYPKEPKRNIKRTDGSYTYYNENTVAITFPATKDEDEWLFIGHKNSENGTMYCEDWGTFTRIKASK